MPANQITNAFFTAYFVAIKGISDLPGMKMKRIEAPGVDGWAFKESSFQAEPSLLTTISAVDTVAEAATLEGNLQNFQGTQVDIYDGHGTVYSGYVVNRVRVIRKRRTAGAIWAGVVSASPVILTTQWVVTYPYGSF